MGVEKTRLVPMEDSIDALIAELVEPLLSSRMVPAPSISQQQDVAKQMHAVVLLYNYYHRKHCPQLNFESFESVCTMAVVANPNLLPYLKKDESVSGNLSIVEQSIMQACNISMALSDNDERTIETWPVEKVAIFLADAKREKCYLERDTLVKGVFSLMEIELEGKKDEDMLEKFVLSKVENQTGISRACLHTWYSRQTYSLSKERSRTTVFLIECSKPPVANKGLVEIPIEAVLNNLKGQIFTCGSKPELTHDIGFFLLLPYANIISDLLSKSTSELEMEIENRRGKPEKSNNKSPMKIQNQHVMVKKELSNGSLKEKNKNGNGIPDKKREHSTSILGPSDNTSVKHMTSSFGPLNSSCLKNVTPDAQFPSNGSLKPVKLGVEGGTIKRENVTGKEVPKGVKQETVNTNMELITVNIKPRSPTKRPILETPVFAEIVPFSSKDFPSCLDRLTKIRDELCGKHRNIEDKIAQCENDIQTIICGGQMTSEVEKILERWEKAVLSNDRLDVSVGFPNQNKKKKLKLRSACQQLDDNCRDNNLALPRYIVHPESGGLYMAIAILKNKDIDCMAKSELKKNPHEAREHAAMLLMQKLYEIEED